MSRHNTAPTHSWIISSKITKYITIIFLVLLVIVLIAIFAIRAVIVHNCQDYYKRNISLPGYWLHVEAGSTKKNCPTPYDD